MFFPVEAPDGTKVLPIGPGGYESCWRFDRKGYDRLLANNQIVWKRRNRDSTEEWWPYVKTYLKGGTKRPSPLWTDLEGSKKASIDLRDLFGADVFDNPKPVGLMTRLMQLVPEPNRDYVVLDFFAGSGTIAEAALRLNQQDGGNRKFILVQLPEPTGGDVYQTIAEICKDRVRRVVQKLEEDHASQFDLGGGTKQDRGFRVFKLAESNFRPWNAGAPKDAEGLARQLEMHADHIREGRTADDLLYEILLKSGFPLTTPVEMLTVAGKGVHSIAGGALFICLERELTLELIRAIAERKPERVVFLDESFAGNDQLKTNAVQIFKIKGVTSFKTV